MPAQVPAISTKIQIQPFFLFVWYVIQTYCSIPSLSTSEMLWLPKLKDCVGKCFGTLKILKQPASQRQKFYFIVLLQVFCSMTARQSSPTENWKERELTKWDLWIKHIKPLWAAVKLRACCWQPGFACLCAFPGKWRSLYGSQRGAAQQQDPSHQGSLHLCALSREQLPQPCSVGQGRAHAHLPAGSTGLIALTSVMHQCTLCPFPSRPFDLSGTSTSEIVVHL